VFLGSHKEPPGGEALYRQATQTCPFLGFYDELPGGDEFLPGGTGLFGLNYDILWGLG